MSVHDTQQNTIKHWSADDRPREKLLRKGRQALSDAELLAILLGSGSAEKSAVALSRSILQQAAANDLRNLSRLTVTELMKFKGIGEAKAVTIVAAMELARRRKKSALPEKPVIRSSHDAYLGVAAFLEDLPHEEFYVLYLNRANRVIATERLSMGGISGTVADHRIIFRNALEKLATGIILAHNHPSGNLRPSDADIRLTQKVKEAGVLLDIQLFDHIIAGNGKYFSFADEGML